MPDYSVLIIAGISKQQLMSNSFRSVGVSSIVVERFKIQRGYTTIVGKISGPFAFADHRCTRARCIISTHPMGFVPPL